MLTHRQANGFPRDRFYDQEKNNKKETDIEGLLEDIPEAD